MQADALSMQEPRGRSRSRSLATVFGRLVVSEVYWDARNGCGESECANWRNSWMIGRHERSRGGCGEYEKQRAMQNSKGARIKGASGV